MAAPFAGTLYLAEGRQIGGALPVPGGQGIRFLLRQVAGGGHPGQAVGYLLRIGAAGGVVGQLAGAGGTGGKPGGGGIRLLAGQRAGGDQAIGARCEFGGYLLLVRGNESGAQVVRRHADDFGHAGQQGIAAAVGIGIGIAAPVVSPPVIVVVSVAAEGAVAEAEAAAVGHGHAPAGGQAAADDQAHGEQGQHCPRHCEPALADGAYPVEHFLPPDAAADFCLAPAL